jgi:hypothetical protein
MILFIQENPTMPELKSLAVTPIKGLSKATNGAANRNISAENDVFNPIVPILVAFNALPVPDREAMFEDFRKAATEKDLRQLLDMISDWAATAELYANPTLHKEFNEAQAGRKEVAEWENTNRKRPAKAIR